MPIKTKNIFVIIQDVKTDKVLTTGIIDDILLKKIKKNKKIYFPSVKFDDLYILENLQWNRDKSSLLIKVKVNKGSKLYSPTTEFLEENKNEYTFLRTLERKIQKSITGEKQNTHVLTMLRKGTSKIAQKFGEEAVELVIETAKDNDELFKDEAADVFYYYLIMLQERGFTLPDILKQLKQQKRKI